MKLGSKTILKCCAVILVSFQGFAIFTLHQEFHPEAFAGALALLFGVNSAHENTKQYLDQKKCNLPAEGTGDGQ